MKEIIITAIVALVIGSLLTQHHLTGDIVSNEQEIARLNRVIEEMYNCPIHDDPNSDLYARRNKFWGCVIYNRATY